MNVVTNAVGSHIGNTQVDKQQLFYGLDIGGTKIEMGVFSSDLILIDSWRVITPTDNYDIFIQAVVDIIHDAEYRHNKSSSQACAPKGLIGIGMPGVIDKNNLVKSANIPCCTGKNIIADLHNILHCKMTLANDCRLFALSESVGGAGESHKFVYGAIIGTGAAGGLCIDGQIYNGSNGFAGEYGHLPVSAYLIDKYNLPILDCGCGLKGCYEPYVSGPGLGWIYNHFGAKTTDTRHFVAKLRENDTIARSAFNCYMDLLGASFASIVLSYDPDIIVLGGGVSNINEVVNALQASINNHLYSGVECPPIVKAKYGDSSGVRGAAILRKQFNDNQ